MTTSILEVCDTLKPTPGLDPDWLENVACAILRPAQVSVPAANNFQTVVEGRSKQPSLIADQRSCETIKISLTRGVHTVCGFECEMATQ